MSEEGAWAGTVATGDRRWMTPQEAITRSLSHNEIVTLDHLSEDGHVTLLVECDDNIESNDGPIEYWGTCNGEAWRVAVETDRKEG